VLLIIIIIIEADRSENVLGAKAPGVAHPRPARTCVHRHIPRSPGVAARVATHRA